ncbi:type II secretion system protein [Cryobacterium glaciale]|uniref:Type II secretion system protein n=1 Tax=Cryobacterium glaciale TaxID=1259145 RepID=A0A4R8V3D5_9MICO|nr:type II secretion system protein [Cryobacterium glaciale]TFB75944.1 type II secretion system protein [Cryobacterium glaciale]
MTGTAASASTAPESGFTLIELLVYVSFTVVILAIIGGMLISSVGTERDVRSTTEATNLGQLISRSVQSGVRNASQVSLQNIDATQFLVARTAGSAASVVWACEAWFYTPAAGGSLYTKRTSPASLIAPPAADDLTSWIKLGDGVSANGAAVFGGINGRITVDLNVAAGTQASVSVNTTASPRTLATVGAPCL